MPLFAAHFSGSKHKLSWKQTVDSRDTTAICFCDEEYKWLFSVNGLWGKMHQNKGKRNGFHQAALGQTSANGHGDRHAHMHQYTKNTQMHKLWQAPSWCRSSWPRTDILSNKHTHAPLSGLVHSGQIKTADPVFTHTPMRTQPRLVMSCDISVKLLTLS